MWEDEGHVVCRRADLRISSGRVVTVDERWRGEVGSGWRRAAAVLFLVRVVMFAVCLWMFYFSIV